MDGGSLGRSRNLDAVAGQMSRIGISMEKPEGRVHFAGEHVSRWQGWMQDTLESGLRAAKEVLEGA